MREGDWQQLSDSSKRAFQFASAAAQERTGLPATSAVLDPWDLLVGILLSHPGTSEAEETFRHYNLVVGQALPPEYPRLTAVGLTRQLAGMPPELIPPTTDEVSSMVGVAVQIGVPADTARVAALRSLWVALLEGSGPASTHIRQLLERRGVNAAELASQTHAWLTARDDRRYADLLEAFKPRPVDVVNYKADQSRRPDSSGTSIVVEDFVGIGGEVDAFAHLLASRNLEPPLAVGLFGDWGSGKSYFLDAIRRRIDQLIASPDVTGKNQRDTPFWKRIAQVEFNAWHYVEGDLWSGLVDHIFTQLNLASEDVTDNVVEERQRYLLKQLKTTAANLSELEGKQEEVARKLEEQETSVRKLELQRDKAIAELKQTESKKIAEQVIKSSLGDVMKALRSIVSIEPPQDATSVEPRITFGEALDSLGSARTELERGRSLFRPFAENPILFVFILLFLVAVPVVAFIVEGVARSAATGVFAGVASLLAAVGAGVGLASRWIQHKLDLIDRARQKVNQEFATAKDAWRIQLEAAEKKVKSTTDQLDELKRTENALRAELQSIRHDLAKKPPELMNEFLRERLEAGEYRQRLGLPAIIRRDFKSLAELIGYQNAYVVAPPQDQADIRQKSQMDLLAEKDERVINRIILYIDDLDRCPDGRVIEVLQAVHLLLAFPLFVVVVAVDSRWLAYALQTRYPALAGHPSSTNSIGRPNPEVPARPDDYLEKIFQLPFWVAPLNDGGRSRIVQGLLGSHVRIDAVEPAQVQGNRATIGLEEAKVLQEMIDPRSGPPLLDVAALTVSRNELAFLDGLAPLMGDTPRSVKRFVNVYQLVKILRRGRSVSDGFPPDEQLTAFLLALAEGLPELGWRLFDQVAEDVAKTPLSIMLNAPVYMQCPAELKCLKEWLGKNPIWNAVPADRIADLTADVSRFLFRVARRGGPGMGAQPPQVVHVIQHP